MADGGIQSAWRQRRSLPMFMQDETGECCLACLAMIANYHGYECDLASMRRRFSTSLKGATLGRMLEIANTLGLEARPLRTEIDYLESAQFPCVLHWDLNHFVVLKSVGRKGAEILDPARGICRMPMSEVSKHFTGIVVEFRPGADFQLAKEVRRVSLRMLTGPITGLKRVAAQILGLAFAIEMLSLLLPFQMQWVVDQVLVSRDSGLLLVLTLAFLIVIAIQGGLSIARSWILSWLGASLNSQWVTNVFSHLLKLPLDYFEKRHMGDIVSRFSSLHSIQTTLTGNFAEAILDGLFGTLALIILALYSAMLTGFVLLVASIYVLLRFALYRMLWRFSEEQLVYGARQQTELMESVRGIQAIKLANKQSERRAHLANTTMEAAQRDMQSQRITLAFGVINQTLFGALRVLLIAMGSYLVLSGKFSAGMLIAFVAYSDQFATKIARLIDRFVDFRMLRLHSERIADIALAIPEKNVQGYYSGPEPEPSIGVHSLAFRYSDEEPWIFHGLDLQVRANESVAIIGPSGCGKSTLAKVILGLLEPNEGSITIGEVDVTRYGLENYRRMIGAVMQDDQLFAGSIAANIAFFDSSASMKNIVDAAKAAAVHDDIVNMTMGYESLVGDMGSSLSGGQKQRIILARALYKKPRVLLLDEATSHLDTGCEEVINTAIAALKVTRIIIAHRDSTIRSADRIVDLSKCRQSRHEQKTLGQKKVGSDSRGSLQ